VSNYKDASDHVTRPRDDNHRYSITTDRLFAYNVHVSAIV